MAEHSPSPLLRVGQNVAASDLSVSQRSVEPTATASEWERVLWNKTAPVFQKPIEEARPFGRREKTPTVLKWLRVIWARRWSKLRARRMQAEIHKQAHDTQAYMTVAQYAINASIMSEKNPKRRNARSRELMGRWRDAYGRVFGSR